MGVTLKKRCMVWSAAGLSVLFAAANAFAQIITDSTMTGSTTTTRTTWYTQWWAWGIGVAVFLIVVIALTNRGGGGKSST